MGQAQVRAAEGAKGGGEFGFRSGGAVGAVAGAVVGAAVATPLVVANRAKDGVLFSGGYSGGGRYELGGLRNLDVLVGPMIGATVTGAPVGALVAIPCAVVGGALGAMEGAAEDLAVGVDGLAQAAKAANENRLRTQDRDERAGKGRETAQLPSEALPLLCALVVAQKHNKISEDEALNRICAFAASCRDGEPGPQLLARAEAAGREVLTFVKLSEAYPHEASEVVQEASEALVAATDSDTLDAVWIVCGAKPLQEWSPEVRASLPTRVTDISPELLTHGLRLKYEQGKHGILDALQRHFPGGETVDDYRKSLEMFRNILPQAAFWKAYKLLEGGRLPEQAEVLTFEHLMSSEFQTTAHGFLATSGALCSSQLEVETQSLPERADSKLLAIARQTQKPLAYSQSHSDKWELQVEVLAAEDLGSPEYRVGDFSKSLFGAITSGSQTLSPYVDVIYDSEHVQTRVLENVSAGRAEFGERLTFQLLASKSMSSVVGKVVEFQVFDARGFQAAVRGDPLIGNTSLQLTEEVISGSKPQTLQLHRENKTQGELKVRVGLLAPWAALAEPKRHSLAEVAEAVACVLAQPRGVDVLLEAMPHRQGAALVEADSAPQLRKTLQAWICRLNEAAKRSPHMDDEVAVKHFASLARSAQQIMAACVADDLDGDEIQMLTAAWVRQVMQACVPEGTPLSLDETRLLRLLEAGRRIGHTEEFLQQSGVKLPEDLDPKVSEAIAARLQEAASCEEEEIFTGVQIVENGRIALGMAAVTRSGREGRVHVFIYDFASINKWQKEKGNDPTTRQKIKHTDILRISPAHGLD